MHLQVQASLMQRYSLFEICNIFLRLALICYAVLSYLTTIKKRRKMYQRGLINAGNQTLNITRKISLATKMNETSFSPS